ncbi:uncharacterized protein LOC120354470 [Nilaparvata lugens]|uniref:uncharacterized protein LOC120354470 n=1 Tax=Nilaparvata lugens TaxID=108931 RepID=UPI00193EADBE|nr:uncharacterized protein LOC120354470 [Nilaparvata lugens]
MVRCFNYIFFPFVQDCCNSASDNGEILNTHFEGSTSTTNSFSMLDECEFGNYRLQLAAQGDAADTDEALRRCNCTTTSYTTHLIVNRKLITLLFTVIAVFVIIFYQAQI